MPVLPSRGQERAYLHRLIHEIEAKARQYSALCAIGLLDDNHQSASLDPCLEDADIALLRLERRIERTEHPFDDILKAFTAVRCVALLGAPGAGKSTTLRRLALSLARYALADDSGGAPIPLFVALKDWSGNDPLPAFICKRIPELGSAFEALAAVDRLVLLLDGLNEVPGAQREPKAEQVRDLLAALKKARENAPLTTAGLEDNAPRTRIVVSCRLDDYTAPLDLDIDTLTLLPLDPPRVRRVLHQWTADRGEPLERAELLFWRLAGDQKLEGVLRTWVAEGGTEDHFWRVPDLRFYGSAVAHAIWRECVPNKRSLLRLAANPFMLHMLYQVWRREGVVPRNRGDLFARFIDRLLAREGLVRWDDATNTWQRDPRAAKLIGALSSLAMLMQLSERANTDDAHQRDFEVGWGVLVTWPRANVVEHFEDASLLKLAEDATLLEGADWVGFRHQLLQEYFAALALRDGTMATEVGARGLWPAERWWRRTSWEEAAVLLAGLYSDDCWPVIDWLKDAQPEVAARCILESGAALPKTAGQPGRPDDPLAVLHDLWLPRLTDIDGEPAPEARAAIGRALGLLELDDRPGIGVIRYGQHTGLPDIAWIDIQGCGSFVYGSTPRPSPPPFRIARYPITHAQFQAFLDAEDGYDSDRWWQELSDPERGYRPARWPIANHPRERVSWHEAMAFCGWLTAKLRPELNGRVIRLPTDQEWERAARGTKGRFYAWGNKYLPGHGNTDEARLGRTSAVGIYPQGMACDDPAKASAAGVEDLIGNVWEWCLNEYEHPERVHLGGSASRAIRGGSWGCQRTMGACANRRHHAQPDDRFADLGFRVVCAAPIP